MCTGTEKRGQGQTLVIEETVMNVHRYREKRTGSDVATDRAT